MVMLIKVISLYKTHCLMLVLFIAIEKKIENWNDHYEKIRSAHFNCGNVKWHLKRIKWANGVKWRIKQRWMTTIKRQM